MNRFGRFLVNGVLLMIASLFMRTVSVGFNVYVSGKIGAEGLGVFSLISIVYGFSLTLATSGINLAATKLVSEEIGKNTLNTNEKIFKTPMIKSIMKRCVYYSLFFSILVGAALFYFSDGIGTKILCDKRTVSSLRLLAFTLPPIAVSSALSGYFTAVRRVYKNAGVQLLGQFIKIFSTVLLFGSVFCKDTETACLAMVIGSSLSEVLSFFVQWILFVLEESKKDEKKAVPNYKRSITKELLGIALPVAFSAYLRSGLVTIEHILIPIGLEKSGANKSLALAAYGTVHSMVFPLVLFPSAILSSFSGLLVPEVAQTNAAQDKERVDRIADKVIRAALIFSVGVAGIVGAFAYELGNTVYPNTDAGKYIRMIAPLIPIMYIDSSIDAMLKGLGQQVYSMWINIVDALMSVILVIFLLPRYGIMGYIITVYFTETLNTALSITRLLGVSSVRPKINLWVIKPLLSIVASTHITKILFRLLCISFSSAVLELCVCIGVSIIIYLLFLLITGSLKLDRIHKYIVYTKNSIK